MRLFQVGRAVTGGPGRARFTGQARGELVLEVQDPAEHLLARKVGHVLRDRKERLGRSVQRLVVQAPGAAWRRREVVDALEEEREELLERLAVVRRERQRVARAQPLQDKPLVAGPGCTRASQS